jgi:hypothetical protein
MKTLLMESLEISNGFTGMKRDVVLKLMKVMNDGEKCRVVFLVCH